MCRFLERIDRFSLYANVAIGAADLRSAKSDNYSGVTEKAPGFCLHAKGKRS